MLNNRRNWLILGDLLAILAVTMVGFYSHYREISGWRWLTTFFPVTAAWFVTAPWLGVYRMDLAYKGRELWRPALAAFLSAPMAAWLRGILLNGAISPVFVLVLGLTNLLGFLIWRSVWVFLGNRTTSNRTQTNG